MGKKIKAIILKFPGTNNDVETARALKIVGAEPDILPVSLLSKKIILNYSLLVLAGGFSYGDYVYAGKLAALELKKKLNDTIFEFAEKDRFILGICNGFQILLELNMLPEGFLAQNKNKHFICQWCKLKINQINNFFTKYFPDEIELPVAHFEGKFISKNNNAEKYVNNGSAFILYKEDINGSEKNIAGLCDKNKKIFGLMPHPERFIYKEEYHSPDIYKKKFGYGYYFFKALIDFLK
ncbi:MAG TPA: phosphoribosylformylglycinamidine synthase I [bacterium]|nr:phosphoribosylformylglycinamidine synthase I [bacterium]HOL48222.1 phosphoribosylformylglycinamidine synthase I [bacterium]HPQ18922.1 phosphoribosylformylglycinamidine synthase I [bacterium]